MLDIKTFEFDEWNVAKIIKSNYRQLYKEAGESADCHMYISDSVSWVNNQHIWPNRIYGLDVEDELDDYLEWIVKGMKSGELPEILTTSIFTQPRNYDKHFEHYGLEKKFDAAGMAVSLDALVDNHQCNIGLDIIKVESELQLKEWCELVMVELFNQPLRLIGYYKDAIEKLLVKGSIKCFLAYKEGEPVATSMSYRSDTHVIGIYHVSTKAAYRGQGIGKQITLAPLKEGKKAGASIGVLFASKLGEPVYKAIGFKSYSTFGRYGLKNR